MTTSGKPVRVTHMTPITRRSRWLFFGFSVGVLSLGCDGRQMSSTPTAPSVQVVATPPNIPVQTTGPQFTLSGMVFEQTPTGRVPLDNVRLYCESCGEIGIGHTFADTDRNGRYSFSGVFNGHNDLQVRAPEGYEAADGRVIPPNGGVIGPTWTMRSVLVNGDTQFDVRFLRR